MALLDLDGQIAAVGREIAEAIHLHEGRAATHSRFQKTLRRVNTQQNGLSAPSVPLSGEQRRCNVPSSVAKMDRVDGLHRRHEGTVTALSPR